jgi:hypothetical protein
MIVFGGGYGLPRNDTWAYTPTDLTATAHTVSVAKGGNVILSLYAGTVHAGKSFLVAGCMDSGRPRGMPLGKVTLLLNPDDYFYLTALLPNTLIANSLGVLDASGKSPTAKAPTVQVPPLPHVPALIGTRFYHAYVVYSSTIDYASTPIPLTLVK